MFKSMLVPIDLADSDHLNEARRHRRSNARQYLERLGAPALCAGAFAKPVKIPKREHDAPVHKKAASGRPYAEIYKRRVIKMLRVWGPPDKSASNLRCW
jgi:hypothetical protein